MAKNELQEARQRLIDALYGIPVQFRSGDMNDAISAMQNTDSTDIEAVKIHGQRLLDVIDHTPVEYITNNAIDAAHHFASCLQAF